MFLELGDDLGFVGAAERRCLHDGGKFGIFGIDLCEGVHGAGDGVEGGAFYGCCVLFVPSLAFLSLGSPMQPSHSSIKEASTYQSTGIGAIKAIQCNGGFGVGCSRSSSVRPDLRAGNNAWCSDGAGS